jgi:cell division protein FtsZ
VDTLIVVSNDKLLTTVPPGTSVGDAFLVADDVLRQGIEGIYEIILKPGVINVDFADVRAIMTNGGAALMGTGTGKGPSRAQDAATAAITSPLWVFFASV